MRSTGRDCRRHRPSSGSLVLLSAGAHGSLTPFASSWIPLHATLHSPFEEHLERDGLLNFPSGVEVALTALEVDVVGDDNSDAPPMNVRSKPKLPTDEAHHEHLDIVVNYVNSFVGSKVEVSALIHLNAPLSVELIPPATLHMTVEMRLIDSIDRSDVA